MHFELPDHFWLALFLAGRRAGVLGAYLLVQAKKDDAVEHWAAVTIQEKR